MKVEGLPHHTVIAARSMQVSVEAQLKRSALVMWRLNGLSCCLVLESTHTRSDHSAPFLFRGRIGGWGAATGTGKDRLYQIGQLVSCELVPLDIRNQSSLLIDHRSV